MSRFDLTLDDVAVIRPTLPTAVYPCRLVKGEVRQGVSENGPWANFNVSMAVLDADAAKLMGVDEPRVFFSGMFSFDDQGHFNKNACPEIGQFLAVTGFGADLTLFESEETEKAETERDYILALFKAMGEACAGTEVKAKVVKKKHFQEDYMVNQVTEIAKA